MIHEELTYRILQNFGFAPTNDQMRATDTFARFMTEAVPARVRPPWRVLLCAQ